MSRPRSADLFLTVAVLLLGLTLAVTGQTLLARSWQLPAADGATALAEVLGVAAALVGTAGASWWLLALAVALLTAIPARRGAPWARRLARCSPAPLRRLAALLLGLHLAAGPATAASAEPAMVTLQQVDRPGAGLLGPELVGAENEAPDPYWLPAPPPTDPGLLVPAPHRPSVDSRTGGSTAAGEVVVRRGDTLWSIAATHLGPFASDEEVAQAWPDWYRRNRDVIGADPHLILPGQVLHAPGS